MRLKDTIQKENFKILAVDDEQGIIDSLAIFLNHYNFKGVTDPLEAIELVKNEHFDLMILDFLMMPIHGDQVVEKIRQFNKNIYILLLTGHKDLAPPLETIKRLDIQGYCEKTDKFDQLLLLIESGLKSVTQMRIINDINNKLENAYDDLKNAYKGTMESLRLAVDAKDSYTKNHSDRVSYYAVLLAKALNLSEEEVEIIKDGGLFHDIGKIGIPDSILQKTARLTDEEYSDIKNHPSIGEHILLPAKIFNNIIPMVKYHHERYDGKGYPCSFSGTNIPLCARIVCIADSFDAMTSDRSYRPRFTLYKALDELQRCKGTQFDPELVDLFVQEIIKNKDNIERELNIMFIERKDDNLTELKS